MDTDPMLNPLVLTIVGGSLVVVGLVFLVTADAIARRASEPTTETEAPTDGS